VISVLFKLAVDGPVVTVKTFAAAELDGYSVHPMFGALGS
jgi:hypothetical protein